MKYAASMFLTLFTGLTLLSSTAHAEVPPNELTVAEQKAGWRLLFDGKSTKNWRNFKADKVSDGWQIKNGELVRAGNGAGDIMTDEQFGEFELSLEYKISKGGNSGLMFHVTEEESTPWRTGPEIQIQDNVDGHDPQKAGWLYQLYKPSKPGWVKSVESQAGIKAPDIEDATRPAGEWNQIYLKISKRQCQVVLNGVRYYNFVKGNADWDKRVAKSKFSKFPKFGKAEKGHICLQDHGNEVAFRSIKIRTIPEGGGIPNPIDGKLPLKPVLAFPNLKWEGFAGIDDSGKVRQLRPMALMDANDGSGQLYVATQRGKIYTFPNDPEVKEAKLFLDLADQVDDFKKDNEEGLLGLAFHPKFKSNGQFFVYYSLAPEKRISIVSRFQTMKGNPLKGDPASEEILMELKQPFANHNGGSIAFGPDGYLYIGLGDGGSRNDPMGNGQNLKTLLGSILRIDVDSKSDGRNYGIPKDNPFVGRKGAKPEIYAYGFRNIWRLAFDRETGHLWAADVGQDLWEEIDIVTRGGNYGWSQREGLHPFGNRLVKVEDEPIDPIWEYDHVVGRSITGGYVYRGKKLPELQGWYLYADYVTGRIWALNYDEQAKRVVKNMSVIDGGTPVLAFGEDADGEVYYFVETPTGKGIYRFESTK